MNQDDVRVLRCRFKWVVRVNFAVHRGQNLVWGSVGTLPLWERILDTLPFLVSLLPTPAASEAVLVDAKEESASGAISSVDCG